MRYIGYEVVPINGVMLNIFKSFVIVGKGQFTVKVTIEGEKHIYIIPVKHSYHYLSSIVIGL